MHKQRSGLAAAGPLYRAGSVLVLVVGAFLLAAPCMAWAQQLQQTQVSMETERQAVAGGGDWDPQTDLMTVIEPGVEADKTAVSPLGDDYDPVSGTITFSATDISLRGNFAIPVELRRWIPSNEALDAGGPADWRWNLPFIRGNYLDVKNGQSDTGWDWGQNTWRDGKNCTGSAATVIDNHGNLIAVRAYWKGKLLHIPGVISETFLDAPDGQQVTKAHFRIIGCVGNASGQEGIVVAGPDGLKYTFNQFKDYYDRKPVLRGPIVQTRLLLVTRIEDRFGNHVSYSYDADGDLTGITASDGRTITISYQGSGAYKLPYQAVAHGQTWRYAYQTSGTASPRLASVTLPDGALKWKYDNLSVLAFNPLSTGYSQTLRDASGQPLMIPGCSTSPTQYTASITTPSGQVSTYTFRDTIQYRSNVEPEIYYDAHADYALTSALNCSISRALISKAVSGPGVEARTWTYVYSGNQGTYAADSVLNGFLTGPFDLPAPAVGGYPAPITSGNAVNYRSTTISGPDQRLVFYIDREFQSITESGVIARDVLNAAGTALLQRETSTFALGDYVGRHWYRCPCEGSYSPVNEKQLGYYNNLVRKETFQDGRRYVWRVPSTCGISGNEPCFDEYARPTKIVKESML